MNMPGFTAETSLYNASGRYHSMTVRIDSYGQREVVSQLQGSVFHRPRAGVVFGTLEDYWICRSACDAAHSACLATCEGTVDRPMGSMHCVICDQDYNACLQGCSRDIA